MNLARTSTDPLNRGAASTVSTSLTTDQGTNGGLRAARLPLLFALLSVVASGPSYADQDKTPVTPTDPPEAAAPASEQPHGSWVLVPVPVANPTLGNGLQLGALYLHAPSGDGPPATSGLGAMATDNGTRLVAAFHDQTLR